MTEAHAVPQLLNRLRLRQVALLLEVQATGTLRDLAQTQPVEQLRDRRGLGQTITSGYRTIKHFQFTGIV
jgi:hypothetical protein